MRLTLSDAAGIARTPLNDAYIYGRGEGSQSRGGAHVVARLEADVLSRRDSAQDRLILEVLELSGEPIDEPGFLELVDHEVRVRGSAS